MPKTVAVMDTQGNLYEATYPRRARGLVRKGRARFVSENAICLTRPPKINDSEEKRMNGIVTINMIFTQLDKIVENNALFEKALYTLADMPSGDIGGPGSVGDIAGHARAEAIADICRGRETTNQQLIRFYEKMYDDLMALQGLHRSAPQAAPMPEPDIPDIPPIPLDE